MEVPNGLITGPLDPLSIDGESAYLDPGRISAGVARILPLPEGEKVEKWGPIWGPDRRINGIAVFTTSGRFDVTAEEALKLRWIVPVPTIVTRPAPPALTERPSARRSNEWRMLERAWYLAGLMFPRGFRTRVFTPAIEELRLDLVEVKRRCNRGASRRWALFCLWARTIGLLADCWRVIVVGSVLWPAVKLFVPLSWLLWLVMRFRNH